jgi:hypothetical protein
LQEKISQLQTDLQKSESRANQSELALQTSRAQLVKSDSTFIETYNKNMSTCIDFFILGERGSGQLFEVS